MVLQDAWLPQLARRVDSVIITASPRGETQCPRDVPEASLKVRFRWQSAPTFVAASAVRKLRSILGQCKRVFVLYVFRKISMRVTGVRSRVSFASARTALELRLGKEARRVHGCLHVLEKDYRVRVRSALGTVRRGGGQTPAFPLIA